MNIYDAGDGLGFDFDGTEPPVFRITVRPRQGHSGAFAEALFRGGHDEHLWSVAAWGQTEEDALKVLLDELRQRYTPKPNRVVVETTGAILGVRAERPGDVVVIVQNPGGPLVFPRQDVYGSPNGLPIKQLDCVKEL